MKLSEKMKEKQLLSFELFTPKQRKVWQICQERSNI